MQARPVTLLRGLIPSCDWRAALWASLVAFVVRWGVFAAGVEVAILGWRGSLTTTQTTVTTMSIAGCAYLIAAAVWWSVYKKLAQPGKVWARAIET